MRLTEDQIYRYSRHILLPEVGGAGQEKLLISRVFCLGMGGLGSPDRPLSGGSRRGHSGDR